MSCHVWSVASRKTVWKRDVFGTPHPAFSPDSRAILVLDTYWDYEDAKAHIGHKQWEFRDLATDRRAAFQIPRPWGEKDKRWLQDVQLSGSGHVVAALDSEGHIWVQKR